MINDVAVDIMRIIYLLTAVLESSFISTAFPVKINGYPHLAGRDID